MSRAARHGAAFALCAATLGGTAVTIACAGPRFEMAELPTEPIAVVYRTVEEADRVLDLFEQQEKAKRE
ncbi:MAG: hypothetical protein ABFS41_13465, partial [Myxococcota bacterium]